LTGSKVDALERWKNGGEGSPPFVLGVYSVHGLL